MNLTAVNDNLAPARNLALNSQPQRSFTHDAVGNVLTDTRGADVFAFTYNARNRPVEVARNGQPWASYRYNALEQMVTRSTTSPGGPLGMVAYIHDLDGHVIAEANAATGVITREYIWLDDLPIAVVAGVNTGTPQLLMVHTDHLARPVRMTDAARSTVWQAAWTPWGEAEAMSGTQALDMTLPGQWFQIETRLAYNWHRHYDPSTGRYTQPDPLGFVDGPSVYAYALNSPFMNVDETGLDVKICVYPNAASNLGHAGFSVSGESATYGWYPSGFVLLSPGEIREDRSDKPFPKRRRGTLDTSGKICKTLPTPPEVDQCMVQCRNDAPSGNWYSLGANNCGQFVQRCMEKCGLDPGNGDMVPNDWIKSIHPPAPAVEVPRGDN